ncbi:MAG: hypothetical protein KKA16_15535 [Alphaproteobacteria bacterium]|nr:hypothetical protein [Alphaproteobacteria bacterium]MBU2378335.1 hypothetical protein [Alphaproteobacteria bacterium]
MFLTPLIAAVALQASPVPPDLSWMAGYWLDCSQGREASETWTDPRGGVLVGAAVTLTARGAMFEYARIAPVDGLTAYVAQPGGAAPTAFPVLEAAGTRVVFQNLDNDFPQRVIYERTGDVLTARIEGHMGDREQAMDWRFDKTELNTRCPTA